MDNFVIFTKSSSQKDNGNSLFKQNFLKPNSYCKQFFAEYPLAV